MNSELGDLLEAVRAKLEAKTIPLTIQAVPGIIPQPYMALEPDPAFAPLLAVFREECKHPYATWHDPITLSAFCPYCKVEWLPTPDNLSGPIRYFTRIAYWEAAPEGALAGAIIVALRSLPVKGIRDFGNPWVEPNPDTFALSSLRTCLDKT